MPLERSKEKSSLMTPDPYHTPGYGGFCPQFKYQIGQTFGRTTSRLLRDDQVASSGRLVLADIKPGSSLDGDRRADLLKSRHQSLGDQKLVSKMVPGYTGFIPKGQHYFGTRYAEGCRNSICDFEMENRLYISKMQELQDFDALQTGRTPKTTRELPPMKSRPMKPLKAVAKEPQPYKSLNEAHLMPSPFYMSKEDPNKQFMSGYTGFVPRSRGLIGMGYPIITNTALNDFTDYLTRSENMKNLPVTIMRKEQAALDTKAIYPVKSGLVPHYTGHIPSQKFRYGKTFGHSTENAMKHPVSA